MASTPRVAVLFDNFGPYHVSRLGAASKHCEIVGIEVAKYSKEYAWNPTECVSFARETLLADRGNGRRVTSQIYSRLVEVVKRHRVEAMLVPGWSGSHAFAAVRVGLSRSIPMIVMSESQESDAKRTWAVEGMKRRLMSMFSAALVGGSQHRAYLETLGMHSSGIHLGYDAVDNDYFGSGAACARSDGESARRRLGLPRRYFLASARFIPKKNLFTLIDAFARYRVAATAGTGPESAPWDLVLLGDGELRGKLVDHIAKHGLGAAVHLPGFIQYPDLPAYYGLAGAFIHASTTEQWGLVVNEAMASGLPVLVSNACGCSFDLVQPGVNGYAFDPTDVLDLSTKMGDLSQDAPLLERMGHASQRIIANWGPDRFAQGLIDSVGHALRSTAPRPSVADRFLLSVLATR